VTLPLYSLLLIIFVILLQIIPSGLPSLLKHPMPLLSYWSLTQNFAMAFNEGFGARWMGITWSLAIEEQFYLVLPFIILYCAPRKLPWFLICAIVAVPLLRLVLYWQRGDIFGLYVLTPCRMDALLLGVFCAWTLRHQKLRQLLLADHTKTILHLSFAVLLIGAAFLSVKSIATPFLMSTLGYSWIAALYACLLLIVVTQKKSFLHSIASNSLLQQLGLISYGVYLLHVGILGLMHEVVLHHSPTIAGAADGLVTLVALLITFAVATLSYKFFERPIVGLGHTFHYQSSISLFRSLGAFSRLWRPFALVQFAKLGQLDLLGSRFSTPRDRIFT
jgi:peptidoglycan/LPS O-acetylase OafA/YrhL